MEPKRKKSLIFLALKVSLSGLLLWVILRKAGLQSVYSHFQSMDLRFFFASSLLHLLIVYIAALRWGLLLDEQYPSGRLFSLNLIGSFFNNILPGAVGGDTVKVYYLYRETRKAGTSFGSVFLDRYIGLAGLLFIGFISGLFAFRDLAAVGMQWAVPLICAVFLLGSLVVFSFRIGKRFAVLRDFYEYLYRYRGRKKKLVKAFFLSLVIQTLAIGMIFIVARGLGEKLTFTALFVFVPIITTVTTLPISISGLGVRESAFVLLFGLVGVAPEASVSISFLWFLSVAAASLLGLVEYIRYKNTAPAGADAQPHA